MTTAGTDSCSSKSYRRSPLSWDKNPGVGPHQWLLKYYLCAPLHNISVNTLFKKHPRKVPMALTPRNSKTLQLVIRNLQDAVNKELAESDVKSQPSQATIQTALNRFKTALSSIGFTIS